MLGNNCDSPFYVFKKEDFLANIHAFQVALNKNFVCSDVAYSVKTNQNVYIMRCAYEVGCMIEVTSNDEYELAKAIGVCIDKIVYNRPLKDKESFIEAVNNNAIVNIECKREIDWLDECIKGKNVGIRLNMNLASLRNESVDDDEYKSRFGFSYENGELLAAILKIKEKGFNIAGIHTHRTTHKRHPSVYRDMVKYIEEIIGLLSLKIEYLDVGGGYYGAVQGKPSFKEYSDAIKSSLRNGNNYRIIVEPGSALIAAFLEFRATVIDTKVVKGIRYVVIDGSRIDVDPLFSKTNYEYEIKYINHVKDKDTRQVVCGCTCLEKDILFEINDARCIEVGDCLIFKKVGAYTMTLTPDFIRVKPSIYVNDNGDFKLIRRKGNYKVWICSSEE